MGTLLFIFLLTIPTLYACNSPTTIPGLTSIHYDSIHPPSISKEKAASSDSCVLRFLTGFNNDTIWIALGNNSKNFVVASTNHSNAYAISFAIKKESGNNIQLKIAGTTFSFRLSKDYLFIDICYIRKNNALDYLLFE